MQADLITISREFGAGASELGALLGDRLGWRVLDADIPLSVAKRFGIVPDSLDQWDEHAPGFFEKIAKSLMLSSPDLVMDPDLVARPEARAIAEATRHVLFDACATPPLIVVGHGAQVVFRERPHTLHLRLVAPITARVRRVMARRSLGDKEAMAIAQRVDQDRAHYVKEYFGYDVRDPLLYALQINTGTVTMTEAMALVLNLIGV
ncbi:MAG: Cytidylate kinaselike family [Gemmatimonadetes bacterium]|nr:Cytidylate kinaselike family [Gemmatimonadota bacterium]